MNKDHITAVADGMTLLATELERQAASLRSQASLLYKEAQEAQIDSSGTD